MRCPICKSDVILVERYTSIAGESRLLFFCNNCDKCISKPCEYYYLNEDKKQ